MDIATKIRMALACSGITAAECAKRLGSTPQSFNNRMKTGKFTLSELEAIAAAMGATFEAHFIFPDGTKV